MQVDGVSPDSPDYRGLSVVMVLLCTSFGAVWIGCMTVGVLATMRRKRKAKAEAAKAKAEAAARVEAPSMPPGVGRNCCALQHLFHLLMQAFSVLPSVFASCCVELY